MAKIKILTFKDEPKTINGYRKGLLLRQKVRALYDMDIEQQPSSKHSQRLARIALECETTSTRIDQILQKDFELEVKLGTFSKN